MGAAVAATRSVLLPDLLSEEDLSRYLGLPRTEIRRLLAAGELPGRLVGGRWITPRVALIAALTGSFPGTRTVRPVRTARRARVRAGKTVPALGGMESQMHDHSELVRRQAAQLRRKAENMDAQAEQLEEAAELLEESGEPGNGLTESDDDRRLQPVAPGDGYDSDVDDPDDDETDSEDDDFESDDDEPGDDESDADEFDDG